MIEIIKTIVFGAIILSGVYVGSKISDIKNCESAYKDKPSFTRPSFLDGFRETREEKRTPEQEIEEDKKHLFYD